MSVDPITGVIEIERMEAGFAACVCVGEKTRAGVGIYLRRERVLGEVRRE